MYYTICMQRISVKTAWLFLQYSQQFVIECAKFMLVFIMRTTVHFNTIQPVLRIIQTNKIMCFV